MNTEEALVEKYKQLLAFYLHEDKLAWDLVYIYIGINSALVSALAIILSTKGTSTTIMYMLCFGGVIINLAMGLILNRNRVHHDSLRFQAGIVEKMLEKMGLSFQMFRTEELIRKEKKVLKSDEGEYRKLKFWERIPSLVLIRSSVITTVAFWVVFPIAFRLGCF